MVNGNKKAPVSAFALFGKSYQLVKKNIQTFAIIFALPAIASIISAAHYGVHTTNKITHFSFFAGTMPAYILIGSISAGLIVFVVLAIAALVLQSMITSLELESAKNKTPDLNMLWQKARKYWLRLFGLALVVSMYIFAGSIIGGLVLLVLRSTIGLFIGFGFVLVAVIFVLAHYYLAPFAMVDQDLPIFAAMETSANYSKQNVASVLSLIGVTLLLGLTGIIPVLGPVIAFALGVAYSVAAPLRYLELKKLAKANS